MPPNGNQVNNALLRELSHRKQTIVDLQKRLYMQTLAVQSVSTLASLYKVQLIELKAFLDNYEDLDPAKTYDILTKVQKLLAMPHNEPVNQILELQKQLGQKNELISGYATQVEGLEGEIRKLKHEQS